MTGLENDRLATDSQSTWQVRWLDSAINEDWSRVTFQTVHNADVAQTILPVVSAAELAPTRSTSLSSMLPSLRCCNRRYWTSSIRLPSGWMARRPVQTTCSPGTQATGRPRAATAPALRIVTGPAPATPPPVPTQEFVVVTSTPTPASVLTAAAIRRTEVAVSLRIGTVTPTPRFLVTATATPENEATAQAERLLQGLPFVVTATPTPANRATATANAVYATAVAITTGTFTPLPRDYITATPTATFVVVTNTPTPADIFALLAQVIAEATRTATAGPPTPFPPGVVTATPTWSPTPEPFNEETVQAQIVMVTIQALTTGTWTPTPRATATPSFTPAPEELSSANVVRQPPDNDCHSVFDASGWRSCGCPAVHGASCSCLTAWESLAISASIPAVSPVQVDALRQM